METKLAMVSTERSAAPESRLWQAVLVNTIEEWVSGPLRLRRDAEKYLFSDDSDFKLVCEQAGMNADALRQRLSKLRKETLVNVDWRAAA